MAVDRPPSPKRNKRSSVKNGSLEKNPFYIQAASSLADQPTRVLKHGDTFGVFDHYGDIKPAGLGEGVYHDGTRYLSGLLLAVADNRPLFLSSTIKDDNDLLAVDLTNPDISREGQIVIPRGTLHLFRSKFLLEGACYERVHIQNYGLFPVSTTFTVHYEADFADIFEVRGTKRARRGVRQEPVVKPDGVVLAYQGLDAVDRRARILFTPAPAVVLDGEARFDVSLPPRGETVIGWTVSCERGADDTLPPPFADALVASAKAVEIIHAQSCLIQSSNEQFTDWGRRAVADIHMMTTLTSEGPYPYAGVPWFSTPFGRDGIITALECLWMNPGLARGVLAYLAANQATEIIVEQDAEPGKILHETRGGEMAALKEIPFGRYYGSVDATPLFVLLAGAYYDRTGDRPFIESIWPNLDLALGWIDQFGDRDGDSFVEYQRHSSKGLVHQGWKDSHDSISHADGELAGGPIALCEVQGYVYAAKRAAADMATSFGWTQKAADLLEQADVLRERFEQAFWCEDLSTYALALDGGKRPCRVRASNAGHCLLTGIARPDHARRAAQVLLDRDSFSEWGIRTLAASEARYNPMSYHNGSVWPHDNALIASGMGRYGLKDQVLEVMRGLFDASRFFDFHRMPELFCGFSRRPGEGPTLYPVACSPQAWSAGAVFLLLQACLGLTVKGLEQRICFDYPLLPPFLKEVRITNLRVGTGSVDLMLLNYGHDVGINVLRREGQVEIVMIR